MRPLFRANVLLVLDSAGVVCAAGAVALLSLFPGARWIGLALVLLAALLLGAGRRASKPSQGEALWPRTPLDIPILLLLLQVGVGFWATALPDQTWVAAGQLLAGLVAYYALVHWSRDRARLRWAVAGVILLGLGLALVAPFAVDWFTERKTFLPPALYRLFPLLLPDSIHPNVMAGSLATLLPLPLALFLALPAQPRRRAWLRGGLLLVCLAQFLILILAKSRGGYLALGAGLWLTLWLSGRRRWAIGLVLLAALLAVWLIARPPTPDVGEPDPTQAALDASTWAFRQQVWQTAIRLIGDFPFTGVGMGNFNTVAELLYGFYAPLNPQAHNLYLQVAADLGLLGLISYLALLLLVLWSAWQAHRRLDAVQEPALRAIAVGGLAGMVATMAHGLVDSHTWGSKGAFIPWAVMGLVVALHKLALPRAARQADEQEMALGD